jgi:hypothetical protein
VIKPHISLVTLLVLGCHNNPMPVPTPQPNHGGTGGSTSTGGNSATAGSSVLATGGTATGGTTGCLPIDAIVAQPIQAVRKVAKPHTVGKRHYRKVGRAKRTSEAAVTLPCPLLHGTADTTPLNQDEPQSTGSCTGNASVGAITTQQFKDNGHHNQKDARIAYQGGTCTDNSCTIPCTCDSCPAAFCPDNNNNDTGSFGSSVLAWMTAVKWIKGYTTADTIQDLQVCLANGSNPIIGIDWVSGFDSPSSLGILTYSGTIRGAHELELLGWDGTNFIGINSWGLWGACRQSQITVNTVIDGTGCGYFKISPATLQRAKFDGDCPSL